MVIVPDGALSRLPFETLVIDEVGPKYLLDVAPPISYCQSFTLLRRLEQRVSAPKIAGIPEVLTVVAERRRRQAAPAAVTIPSRNVTMSAPQTWDLATTALSPGAAAESFGEIERLLDDLPALPYARVESNEVRKAFEQEAISVEQLIGEEVAESAFRIRSAGAGSFTWHRMDSWWNMVAAVMPC